MKKKLILDCTLRDGGYYNNWDFESELVESYLLAMDSANVDYVEIGLRTLENTGFKGAFAFTTEEYLSSLDIPKGLTDKIAVMLNGSEIKDLETQQHKLKKLFSHKETSKITLVRIACHVDEFKNCLPASIWLKEHGYKVGFNLMQIGERTSSEIKELAKYANGYPLDVLYFADSMGSLYPDDVISIINSIKSGWDGEIGIHTHDNMCNALINTLTSIENGVSWIDSTVTGMGRGPGNVKTEYILEAVDSQNKSSSTKLFELIRHYFEPLKEKYKWGTNHYYFLTGKYGIHPTYVQEMLRDSRYSDIDIIGVINQLKNTTSSSYSKNQLDNAMSFYTNNNEGNWSPEDILEGRNVLIIGTGPGAVKYKAGIENFIRNNKVITIALNLESSISSELIDLRVSCHPVRLLADCDEYRKYSQPLIVPFSSLPVDISKKISSKNIFDYGLNCLDGQFEFKKTSCVIPKPLVVAYALSVVTSGKAENIYLAGFDGYDDGDSRNEETESILSQYEKNKLARKLISITPTKYKINVLSLYGVL